jgi:hypothetical protein
MGYVSMTWYPWLGSTNTEYIQYQTTSGVSLYPWAFITLNFQYIDNIMKRFWKQPNGQSQNSEFRLCRLKITGN